jgi:hypothetical protein
VDSAGDSNKAKSVQSRVDSSDGMLMILLHVELEMARVAAASASLLS